MTSENLRRSLKRLFDIVAALMACVCLLPVVAAIAMAIKFDDGGSILFVQQRVGRNRRNFRCYKFRTMVPAHESSHPLGVSPEDPRITRVGRLLRLWTLDEIPQLLNVLKGDMSIVGPRPWVPRQASYYATDANRRFSVRPGMAGWAWIHGRNRLPWEDRVVLDLWYVDHWCLRLDFTILIRAFALLLRREGVYGDNQAHAKTKMLPAIEVEIATPIAARRSA